MRISNLLYPCRCWSSRLFILGLWTLAAARPAALHAQSQRLAPGHVRLGLSAGDVFTARPRRRSAQVLQMTLEYEWLLWPHIAMAVRSHPFVVYTSPPVLAFGLGALNRAYTEADGAGGFVELGTSVLLHGARFVGNSAHVNLLSTFAIGLTAREEGLSVALFVQHASNAGMARYNTGWNALGLRLGLVWPNEGRREATVDDPVR